jgi:endonuclease III
MSDDNNATVVITDIRKTLASIEEDAKQNMEVVAEDIFGIVYYIDKYNNVYKTEDILKGVENPQVIAKCKRLPSG